MRHFLAYQLLGAAMWVANLQAAAQAIQEPGGSAALLQLLNHAGLTTTRSAGDSPADALAGEGLLSQHSLPSSFVYGGESSRVLLGSWPKTEQPPDVQADRTIYQTTWREPGGGLAASWRVEVFKNWPAMEFRWAFSNDGKAASKPLTQVEALDLSATMDGRKLTLIHSSGGLADSTGFTVTATELGKTASLSLAGAGGRSSGRDLPFFVVHAEQPAQGIFIGVGWSGQWQAVVSRDAGKLQITTGMPDTNIALPPGERIISPSILLGTADGPWTASANLLRRLLYVKYAPLLNGVKPLPPVSWNHWFLFDNRISESILKAQADGAAAAGVEYFCIDSGWYDGGFWRGTGNWTLDKNKFPHGLGPIADHVTRKGMKLGLWFEPEHAEPGTRLALEHPEWVRDTLVDLGNPAARDWLFDMMKGFIDQGHVRWIRWDFNTPPLAIWNRADAPGQHGLTQIRHVMGLYQLLDRVLKAYPDLLIEGCAGGGQRIDLETIRRSHTFWKSDSTADLQVIRSHETGGNVFLPAQLLNTNLPTKDAASTTLSLFGGPLGLQCDWTKLDAQSIQRIGRQIALYKQLRPLLNEEYYPLFSQQMLAEPGWVGWQFHSPARGVGFVVVERPAGSPYPAAEIALRGLDPAASYQWIPQDGAPGDATTPSGAQLGKNFHMELKPGTSAVYRYQKVD